MVKTLLALVLILVLAAPVAWAADTTKKADKPVVKGTIVAIDKTANTFTVRDEAGKDTVFVLSGKWMHNVKEGEMVAVHYKQQGEKKIVQNIVAAKHTKVAEPKPEAKAPEAKDTATPK